MKRSSLRLLSLLLCAAMLLGTAPLLHANAAIEWVEDEYEAYYQFTSFAELKELASQNYDTYTEARYASDEPLVIEEDLTMPENLGLTVWCEVIIPEGVTMNAEDNNHLWFRGIYEMDCLTVNGILNVTRMYTWNLTVNGTLNCSDAIVAYEDEMIVAGEENIHFTTPDACYFHGWPVYDSAEDLKIMSEQAARYATERHRYMLDTVYWDYPDDNRYVTIDESVLIPEYCTLNINANYTPLAPDCTLETNGIIFAPNMFVIQGTLINNAGSVIALGAQDKLSFENGGTYSGEGTIRVEKGGVTQPADAIIGLDLSQFRIDEYDGYWELYYIGDEVAPVPELVAMYSVFNPDSLEHMFAMKGELAALEAAGWVTVGISFYSATEGIPVYRLFNPTNYSHYYCINEQERANLIAGGWLEDGILCFTQEGGIPIYDLFNPNTYLHYYTAMRGEIDRLVSEGWIEVGLAWFAAIP